jgi:hypothetical protein
MFSLTSYIRGLRPGKRILAIYEVLRSFYRLYLQRGKNKLGLYSGVKIKVEISVLHNFSSNFENHAKIHFTLLFPRRFTLVPKKKYALIS